MLDPLQRLSRLAAAVRRSAATFAGDVGHGLLEVTHNSFALIGLLLVGVVLFGASKSEFRHEVETRTLGWLQARHEARTATADVDEAAADDAAPPSEPDAVARATASDPRHLNRQQAAIALWLSRRYRVALEPVSRLVQEAWEAGARSKLDPTLILAIMAVESSFNPFAQSAVGAQGLMQVMTKVHDDKYEAFGGRRAAFDPITNVRVGVQVLKECIARAGGVEAGLRFYVGAGNLAEDGGYAGKVLSEQNSLRLVASGLRPPPNGTVAVGLPRPRLAVDTPSRAASTPAVGPADAPVDELPEKIALLR